jgi:hypothetical protein
MTMTKAEYVVLCGQIVGSQEHGFECVYDFDGERFADREKAIKHGFKVRGSDDFNIGVIEDGKLVSLDWMDKPVDTDADILGGIAEQVFGP